MLHLLRDYLTIQLFISLISPLNTTHWEALLRPELHFLGVNGSKARSLPFCVCGSIVGWWCESNFHIIYTLSKFFHVLELRPRKKISEFSFMYAKLPIFIL